MTMRNNPPTTAGHTGLKLVLAWGFVGIPLVWGVVQTLLNAIKAFH
jgi:hypothetical protein